MRFAAWVLPLAACGGSSQPAELSSCDKCGEGECISTPATEVAVEDWPEGPETEFGLWQERAGVWEIDFGNGTGAGKVQVILPLPVLGAMVLQEGDCQGGVPFREPTETTVSGYSATPVHALAVRTFDHTTAVFDVLAASGSGDMLFLEWRDDGPVGWVVTGGGCMALADGTDACHGVLHPMFQIE